MAKPTFVFVPGAWNSPDYYDGIISSLSQEGYPSEKISLPSVGCNPVTFDFKEDVNRIADVVKRLVDEKKDVVLVMHSYGGQPGSEAVKGLVKKERRENGLQGGVIRLVFIMAFMVPEGFQATQRGSTEGMRDFMKVDFENGIVNVEKEDIKPVWFHDLPDEEAEYWASKAVPQSVGVFWSTSTYAGWRHIPSTYVVCSDDKSFGVPYAEYLINSAKESGPVELVVETIDAGHFPMLSQPSKVVDVLRRAAETVDKDNNI
ncbi:Alpha/beta hydrolase fold-1 [Massariosphaeria phaeospora]|uniref:Alpha/beta hydrolase fold-1 n=1 Tax=Massariosphaeria phaeospora TaxID=100035 RepID=A0A7C8I3R8_9PLEO|nr:Alpha/beta hydrolase fold-1 [Massariosphaeria phaeospora]